MVIGRTGLDAVDPTDPTVLFLSDLGFAMLMFTVGAHIPLRDRRLPASLRSGAVAAGIVLLLAPLGGLAAASFAGTGDAALYAVILGSGSAAAVLPMITRRASRASQALTVIGQVTIADVVTIVAIPLVLQPGPRSPTRRTGARWSPPGPPRLRRRALGLRTGVDARLRKRSKQRRWALDLRLSLLVLFTLSWIAQKSGTSVLVAGFATGLLVAAFGRPSDCSPRSAGWPTASSSRCSSSSSAPGWSSMRWSTIPSILRLTIALVVLNVAVHLLAAGLSRQRMPAALMASAQLGVPAAVVTLGLQAEIL